MSLSPHTRLGPYEIASLIGTGGMGEVYRAVDTRLGREVAVKVIAEALAADEGARARFEREARAVASLSHPNILALHDVGRDRDVVFAVMELLEGESLDRHLADGPLSWTRAVDIARAIADGLASAHGKGLVHRDLKPANVFLTNDGLVKILDFGLARRSPFAVPGSAANTVQGDTTPGLILGTVGYMAPEQVNGEPADPRSDVFALGCVLYEMLTGRPAFRGTTQAETLASILRDRPVVAAAASIPSRVTAIVDRCLEKDPASRFQSARDLAFALREASTESLPLPPPPAGPAVRAGRGRTVALAAMGVLAVAAGVFWYVAREPSGGQPPAMDAYLRGQRALEKRSEPDLRSALSFFQASIDADPTYAPAYVGLAETYEQLGYGSYVSPEDSFPRARQAAERALVMDASLAPAHAALGYALMYYDWNFPSAEAEFRRAIALDRSSATAHEWYAYLLTAMERPVEEALKEIDAAKGLDPLSPAVLVDRAYILHYYGQNANALKALQDALDINPKFLPVFFWRGRIYTQEGRYDEADAALKDIGPLRSWTPAMATLGYLYARERQDDRARGILEEFAARRRQGQYADGYAIAVVQAGLGDREAALATLESACQERSHWLVWLKRDPRLDDLRPDARFTSLVRKVGLPE